MSDDAFIAFRYAHNLATHGELVFNPGVFPPERVEGYTNFLWVILLALAERVGVPAHQAAPILTQTFGLLALPLTAGLLERVHVRTRTDGPEVRSPERGCGATWVLLGPAVLLAATPEYVVWLHGGLETSFATFLVLASVLSYASNNRLWAAAFASAAVLTRLDASVPIVAHVVASVAFDRTWVSRRAWPMRARQAVMPLAVALVPVALHMIWRRCYYGSWLPNTFAIKAHADDLRWSYGLPYVLAWIHNIGLVWMIPLALLVRRQHLVLVVPIVVTLLYVWMVGGDFMAYGRFLVPATAMLAVLVVWLLQDARTWCTRFRVPMVAIVGPFLLFFGLLARSAWHARARWIIDRASPQGWLDGRWEGVHAMNRFARVRFAVGTWMRENLPADALVVVGAAGALPYASGLPIVDALGLNDPVLGSMPEARQSKHARPGHQVHAPTWYIHERDPALVCHVGFVGQRIPSEASAPAGFAQTWTWACIAPGPVPDTSERSGTFDAGYYCCRRPRGRDVGPFRDGGAR